MKYGGVSDVNHITGILKLINPPPCLKDWCAGLFKSSEVPQKQKGPQEGSLGVNTASICMLDPPFSPQPGTSSLCFLFTAPPAATGAFFFFLTSMFCPLPFHCTSSQTLFFSLLFPPPPHECWWHWFRCNWAALEPRLQITGSRRGFTFPENPNLSNLKCWDAWHQNLVFPFLSLFFFFALLLEEGVQPMQPAASVVKWQKRIYHISAFGSCILQWTQSDLYHRC